MKIFILREVVDSQEDGWKVVNFQGSNEEGG